MKEDFNILLKLMVLGDSGVGKTSFIHRFVDGDFCEKYVTTVGIDFREKTIELPQENRKISLQVREFSSKTEPKLSIFFPRFGIPQDKKDIVVCLLHFIEMRWVLFWFLTPQIYKGRNIHHFLHLSRICSNSSFTLEV